MSASPLSNDSVKQVAPEQAVAPVEAGAAHVVVSVGADPEDPVVIFWRDRDHEGDDVIQMSAVAGWSEGVTEAVCDTGSDFFGGFLAEGQETASYVLVQGAYHRDL
jgi:hypothetical protein